MGGRASPKLSKNIRTKLEGPWAAVLSLVIASSSPGTGWQLPAGSGDRLAPGWTLCVGYRDCWEVSSRSCYGSKGAQPGNHESRGALSHSWGPGWPFPGWVSQKRV